VIKKRLRNKQPRTQLLTLELIEYLTCVCSQNVHTVFHDKEFLQQLNTMLSQNTSDEVRQDQ
jgi:endonuclease III